MSMCCQHSINKKEEPFDIIETHKLSFSNESSTTVETPYANWVERFEFEQHWYKWKGFETFWQHLNRIMVKSLVSHKGCRASRKGYMISKAYQRLNLSWYSRFRPSRNVWFDLQFKQSIIFSVQFIKDEWWTSNSIHPLNKLGVSMHKRFRNL